MGSPSCFYAGRGSNKKVRIRVKYASGRVEFHEYGNKPTAERNRIAFLELPTVTSVDFVKVPQ